MSDYYSKGHLPLGVWVEYRKKGTTWMVPANGPFTVKTKEGKYELPDGWHGFIALDVDDHPYPIEADVHARSYERVA